MPVLRIAVLTVFALAGCAHTSSGLTGQGPADSKSIRLEVWSKQGPAGTRVVTRHYLIYSTLEDRNALLQAGRLMEGALAQYRSMSPNLPDSARPMECYLFARRAEWAAFTRAHTGEDSPIYLQVNRGGYTIADRFVAYWLGDPATWSVAAHEGWHQYVARHLAGRLPPFLEEGLACLFEQVRWEGQVPRWNLTENHARLMSLRNAADSGQLIPLSRLIRIHAGQVVGKPSAKIEAFYAQSWAFARFLNEGDGGLYRPALARMLADAAQGKLFDDTSKLLHDGPVWDPSTAKPILEHYLGLGLPEIETSFARFVARITLAAEADAAS
jgi:hypothetical protein